MIGVLEPYDWSKYDFSEETWRFIYAYEAKLRGSKVFKRVHFKESEYREFMDWFYKISRTVEFKSFIVQQRYLAWKEEYTKKDGEEYFKRRLESIIHKNKMYFPKVSREGLKYQKKDVLEFFLILLKAREYNLLAEIIGIPDVWYIARNIKENYNLLIGEDKSN